MTSLGKTKTKKKTADKKPTPKKKESLADALKEFADLPHPGPEEGEHQSMCVADGGEGYFFIGIKSAPRRLSKEAVMHSLLDRAKELAQDISEALNDGVCTGKN